MRTVFCGDVDIGVVKIIRQRLLGIFLNTIHFKGAKQINQTRPRGYLIDKSVKKEYTWTVLNGVTGIFG